VREYTTGRWRRRAGRGRRSPSAGRRTSIAAPGPFPGAFRGRP